MTFGWGCEVPACLRCSGFFFKSKKSSPENLWPKENNFYVWTDWPLVWEVSYLTSEFQNVQWGNQNILKIKWDRFVNVISGWSLLLNILKYKPPSTHTHTCLYLLSLFILHDSAEIATFSLTTPTWSGSYLNLWSIICIWLIMTISFGFALSSRASRVYLIPHTWYYWFKEDIFLFYSF